MEDWQRVWREGVAPLLNETHLEALRRGLAEDDPRLVQGTTTEPRPFLWARPEAVQGACALGYCGWQGEDLKTVGQVNEYFEQLCGVIDDRLGERGGCRFLINWVDETPRDAMRPALLAEVERTLTERKGE